MDRKGALMIRTRFTSFAWGVLLYCIPVIVWGAFVRATNSGDGCGSHWPLCDGQVIPTPRNTKIVIEFTHRAMSGIFGFLVLGLVVWAFRVYPREHRVRKAALATLAFTIVEALIGRALVKYGWVGRDASVARAVVMGLHLANTFFLLGAAALTALWASGMQRPRLKEQGAVAWGLGFALFGLTLLAISGAVAALGDTLYPARSIVHGIRQDLSPTAHFLIRLRVLHPLLAAAMGLYIILIAGLVSHLRPSPDVKRYSQAIGVMFLVQIFAGFFNFLLLAPIWMQLTHLLLADVVWIYTVLLAGAAVAEGVPQAELALGPPVTGKATARDYIALTKPRVISLLLFTTLAAMFIARPGWPGIWLLIAVGLGGYMAAGAANTFNMVIERDLDGKMTRTSTRPTVTQRISSRNALVFGFILAGASFALLWAAANLLAAVLAFAGLVFYVIVYTLFLKRRTWQNIVIGGAAGAFPPLVGWAAVHNDLSALAWYLFAIIFVWTPVHFWALALLIKEEYAAAGVPMLPVVRGERFTVSQIGLYTVVTVAASALPLLLPGVGWVYLGAVVVLNAMLGLKSMQLYRNPDRPRASSLFHYSMLYLALLFLFLAVDRSMHLRNPLRPPSRVNIAAVWERPSPPPVIGVFKRVGADRRA